MKILVLDGGNANTLAIVRYLGKRPGLELHVVGYNKLAQACYSRYVSKKFFFPSVKSHKAEFSRALLERLQAEKYDLLMPVGFLSYEVCHQNRQEIERYTKVILTTDESFQLASSKLATYRFAQDNGIPCPKTYFVSSADDLRKLDAPFPLVIKAPFEMGKNVVEYAHDKEELLAKFEKLCREYNFTAPNLPVVQQFVVGDGYGFFAYYERGVCIKRFMHRRIREYPVTGGASVCAESFYDEQLEKNGQRILDLVKWNGVAMVEFKKHSDGEYKLMEINPKFWGSLELALAAGVDFPYCLVQQARGEAVQPSREYGQVRFQWLLNGELFHFFERPSAFFRIVADLFRSKKDCRISDPLPNFIQFLLIFLHICKKIAGK
jgi:predicted ATP-grasp superfamily ATP-dependent carboligase